MSPKNLAQLLLLAAIWGASFLFLRICAPVLGAVPTAFGRVLFAALGLAVILVVMRVPLAFRGRLKVALFIGAINSGLPFLMYALAARVLPAGYISILNSMTPLMGIVIGATFFGESVTVRKVAGVGAGLFGVWVLTETGPITMNTTTLFGVLFSLVATTCYGLGGYLTKLWLTGRDIDNRVIVFGTMVGAVISLAPVMVWYTVFFSVPWSDVGLKVWGSLLALGLVCTSLSFLMYFWLIYQIGPLKTMSVTFLIPVFGVLWGWLLLGESLSLGYALGGGIIGVALWLVVKPGKNSRSIN